ncbi:ATP-binding protein [uncultured Metabacillus sp.]|uniref:ATP-binding protein n=1 Tax=uncultured Metabacillus sp. TaxID=2860135 RepID=UPI002619FAA6|nr:ATP-binding protein [uncultured Metabacillus sp.]
MSLDIFNPQISVVAKGLEGKVITIVGGNNLGKTKQATRMKKPLYLAFEKGLNAIAGVPFMAINKWSDFKKVVRQLEKNTEKAKEMYQTIIFDQVGDSAKFCSRHICNVYGVDRIKDGNDGFGLWNEYETEYWEQISKLLGPGFTVVFIAHAEADKTGKFYPKGDKRSLAPVINNSDIVAFLKPNGVDEDGNVIKSSAYLAETDEFFARSRFDYIDTYIEEYTAESLEAAIVEAIERQEEEEGIQAVTFTEQKSTQESEEYDFNEVMEKATSIINEIMEKDEDNAKKITKIIEKNLGKNSKLSEAEEEQADIISLIVDELQDFLEELE